MVRGSICPALGHGHRSAAMLDLYPLTTINIADIIIFVNRCIKLFYTKIMPQQDFTNPAVIIDTPRHMMRPYDTISVSKTFTIRFRAGVCRRRSADVGGHIVQHFRFMPIYAQLPDGDPWCKLLQIMVYHSLENV